MRRSHTETRCSFDDALVATLSTAMGLKKLCLQFCIVVANLRGLPPRWKCIFFAFGGTPPAGPQGERR